MAQGKLKVKAKLPKGVKKKKSANKGPSVSKRANCPITPKKKKFEEANKIKKMISKSVNQAMEVEMRSLATSGKKNFTKAEQAVAAHNSSMQVPGTSK
ncbi:uncharacterized protein CBL_13606 [Carabus blaptoides fortunei]